jgi:hypothetical protein
MLHFDLLHLLVGEVLSLVNFGDKEVVCLVLSHDDVSFLSLDPCLLEDVLQAAFLGSLR